MQTDDVDGKTFVFTIHNSFHKNVINFLHFIIRFRTHKVSQTIVFVQLAMIHDTMIWESLHRANPLSIRWGNEIIESKFFMRLWIISRLHTHTRRQTLILLKDNPHQSCVTSEGFTPLDHGLIWNVYYHTIHKSSYNITKNQVSYNNKTMATSTLPPHNMYFNTDKEVHSLLNRTFIPHLFISKVFSWFFHYGLDQCHPGFLLHTQIIHSQETMVSNINM